MLNSVAVSNWLILLINILKKVIEEILPIYYLTGNLVEKGVGEHGGLCLCPDGSSYQVGSKDNCESLECINGQMTNCNKRKGAWSYRKVTCEYKNGKILLINFVVSERLFSIRTLKGIHYI